MIRKWKLLLVGVSCVMGTAMAQNNPILLFPKGAPGETTKLIEKADADGGKTGGETVLRITNVSEPTITVYPAPDEVATGAAVVVCPGGGYNILAYDLEGDEVCEWLNNLGVTAVLLKYRVPRREGRAKHEAPLQDVQRAIGYVRTHAEEMNLDPQRIGVMGFSAGGHLSAMASNNFDKRTYPAVDAADKASCRPDFCLLVYINSSLFYYYALKEAGVPAWMHLYSKGGHGYGLRDTGAAVNEWPDRAEDWFREIGVIE